MEVMSLLLFIGVVFVVGAGLAFLWSAGLGTFDHTERLALLPLDDPQEAPEAPRQEAVSEQELK